MLRITRAGGRGSDVQAASALFDLITVASVDDRGGEIVDQLRRLACRPMSIHGYADELGLSVAELRDATRRASGATPQDVVLTTRLNEAKALLAESELPVAVIARQVGYDDPAYFSRLFSSRVGQSPRDFRRHGAVTQRSSSF